MTKQITHSKPGKLITKTIPNFKATVEKMSIGQWYKFGKELYHGWYMYSRSKAKDAFAVEVKQQDNMIYVRKKPVLSEKIA